MGKQEEAVKAVLTELISGLPSSLTKSERGPLVDWIVTKLIVLDVFRDGEQAFTELERAAFYAQGTVPDSLSVWLLRCGDGAWKTLFLSHAQRVTKVIGETWADAKPPTGAGPNLKLFLWGVGEALIVAAYAREIDVDLGMQDAYAIQLVPDQASERVWPPVAITAAEAASLQHTLTNLSASMGGRLIELSDDGSPFTNFN